jgi:hypothetical protein
MAVFNRAGHHVKSFHGLRRPKNLCYPCPDWLEMFNSSCSVSELESIGKDIESEEWGLEGQSKQEIQPWYPIRFSCEHDNRVPADSDGLNWNCENCQAKITPDGIRRLRKN